MISNEMKHAIRTRTEVQHVFVCLRRLLALYDDVSIYYDVIFRRIQYAGLIGDEKVNLCVDDGMVDLVLDADGLTACRDILGGYLPIKDIDDGITYLQRQNAIISNQNTQLGILRNCSVSQLKSMLNEADSYFKGANIELIREMLQEELHTRSLYGRFRAAVLNLLYRVRRYPRLLESAYAFRT
jgi:hypothetical protein